MTGFTTIAALIVEGLGALSGLLGLLAAWLAGRRGTALRQAESVLEVQHEQLADAARPARGRDELLERMRRGEL